jgi:hypothetical protein
MRRTRSWIGPVGIALASCHGEPAPRPADPPREPAGSAGSATDPVAIATRPVPCISSLAEVTLAAVDDNEAALCWNGRCVGLALSEDEAKPVVAKRPSEWLHHATIRDRGGPAACVDDACTPIGGRHAAAIHDANAAAIHDANAAAIPTADRKAVAIGNAVWSIADDRPMPLHPPPAFGSNAAKPYRTIVAGPWVVVTWVSAACSDPSNPMIPECNRWAQLVDSTGVARGSDLEGYDPAAVGQFDDNLWFVASRTLPNIAFLDIASGKLVRELDRPRLGVLFRIVDAIRIRPGLMAVLLLDDFVGYHLLQLIGDSSHPLEVTKLRYLPFCESPLGRQLPPPK